MKKALIILTAVLSPVALLAQLGIANIKGNNNGTFTNGTDDYITFIMQPPRPTTYYEAPYTYTVTATQNGSPVGVTLSDGTAATDVGYKNFTQPFRLANGTAGKGNVIITVTPNWGSYAATSQTLTDPGVSLITPCSGAAGNKTAIYTYTSPINTTDAAAWPAVIPKFDASGGKTLISVKIDYTSTNHNSALFENLSSTTQQIIRSYTSDWDPFISYNATDYYAPNTAIYNFTNLMLPLGIAVPAQGTWPGDIGGSTISGMNPSTSNRWLEQDLRAFINPLTDPRWVTNATGNATTDDDIVGMNLMKTATVSTSQTFTAAADLANFTGTGTIPVSYSTWTNISSNGSGNLNAFATNDTYFDMTVTYTYSEVTCQNVSGKVFNDYDLAANGINNLSGTNAGGLTAVLVDANGIVVGTATVAAGGTYTISNVTPAAGYTVLITTEPVKVGDSAPAAVLPPNWVSTGENNGTSTANDGTPNAKSATFTVTAGSDYPEVNFGIYQPGVTPVSFGDINAKMVNGKLVINWVSLLELNNARFDIELSKDGQTFTKIGTVNSKAPNGNSSEPLSYSFEIANTTTMGFAGVSLFIIGLVALMVSRRKKWLYNTAFIMSLGLLTIVSCSKKEAVTVTKDNSFYVRIAQVDKDGNKSFSKIIKVVGE